MIRDRRLAGFKIRRQHPCCGFILDFYCAELRLAIELDGGQHYQPETMADDARRTAKLRNVGIDVLRFQTDLVLSEPAAVMEEIARHLGL
jgi:very-short-patch-repair endonuclease